MVACTGIWVNSEPASSVGRVRLVFNTTTTWQGGATAAVDSTDSSVTRICRQMCMPHLGYGGHWWTLLDYVSHWSSWDNLGENRNSKRKMLYFPLIRQVDAWVINLKNTSCGHIWILTSWSSVHQLNMVFLYKFRACQMKIINTIIKILNI